MLHVNCKCKQYRTVKARTTPRYLYGGQKNSCSFKSHIFNTLSKQGSIHQHTLIEEGTFLKDLLRN